MRAFFLTLLLIVYFLTGFLSAADSTSSRPGILGSRGMSIYYDSQGPLNFNTLTFKSLPPGAILLGEVKERSCQYGISIPLLSPHSPRSSSSLSGVQGNSSFRKIMESLRKRYPDLDGIYDVKMDRHRIRVLGIFSKLCIEVSAQGFQER